MLIANLFNIPLPLNACQVWLSELVETRIQEPHTVGTSGSKSVEAGAEAASATRINTIMITEYLKPALRLKQVELQTTFSANYFCDVNALRPSALYLQSPVVSGVANVFWTPEASENPVIASCVPAPAPDRLLPGTNT